MVNKYEAMLDEQEAAAEAAKLDKELKAPSPAEQKAMAAVEARKQEESNRMARELASDEEESDVSDQAAAQEARNRAVGE